MFRDTSEELQRLEDALLAEEPVEEVIETDDPTADEALLEEDALDALLQDTAPARGRVIYQNYSNDYGRGLRNYASGYNAYNSDTCDEDLDSYSDNVLQTSERGHTGLVVLACTLAVGILAVLIWCLLRYGGYL